MYFKSIQILCKLNQVKLFKRIQDLIDFIWIGI